MMRADGRVVVETDDLVTFYEFVTFYSFVIFKIFISLYGSCFIFIHFICFHLDILCEYWSVL